MTFVPKNQKSIILHRSKMKVEAHLSSSRRRLCTSTTALTAVAYLFGVMTSPFLLTTSPNPPPPTTTTSSSPEAEFRRPSALEKEPPEAELARFNAVCADKPVAAESVRAKIIAEVFNGTSPFENFPPEHVKGLLQPRRLKGWGSTAPVFAELIREVQPRIIIEVGTFVGASALHMVRVTKEMGLNSTVVCIDDWRGWPGFRRKVLKGVRDINGDSMLMYQFLHNVLAEGPSAQAAVVPLPFSSAAALRSLCDWGIYADLIEVDAAHDFLSAWADINAAHALLSPRGVLFGHDYHTKFDNHGVRRAVNLFARLRGLRVQPHGEHWILRPRLSSSPSPT